jgi:hypothetical protein
MPRRSSGNYNLQKREAKRIVENRKILRWTIPSRFFRVKRRRRCRAFAPRPEFPSSTRVAEAMADRAVALSAGRDDSGAAPCGGGKALCPVPDEAVTPPAVKNEDAVFHRTPVS